MECFIKKIFENKIDEKTHKQFVRFGRGFFENRGLLSVDIKDKLIIKGSFEYTNDFVMFLVELGNFEFSGIILSKEKLFSEGKKKGEVYEFNFVGNSEDVKKIYEKSYYLLLDAKGENVELKTKKKLPKPGKNKEIKIDDKFCIMTLDKKYFNKVKEAFFWDVPEGKNIKISHDYDIKEIIIPKDEKDFEMMRLKARRKGILIRKIIVDKKEIIRKKEFEV